MVILKVLKRLFWDCWVVLFVRILDRTRKISENADEALISLVEEGFYEFRCQRGEEELIFLENLFLELEEKLGFENHGQANGRISANGLLDSRLIAIVEKNKLLARKFLGENCKLDLTYFQKSKPERSDDDVPGGQFHIDHYKPTLKFFTYLSDVSEKNGPLVIVPKTHGWRASGRLLLALNYAMTKSRSSLYAKRRLLDSLSKNEKKITGVRGSCFVTDTSAWHRASKMVEGQRLVFVVGFR